MTRPTGFPEKSMATCLKALTVAASLFAALLSTQASANQREISQSGYTSPSFDMAGVHLPEPLVRTTVTTAGEDAELTLALTAYRSRAAADDLEALQQFAKTHSRSGWAAAINTNLGLLYLHYGYFSRALQAWNDAWHQGKDATDPDARAIVDRAVGERARLLAGLGQVEVLEALFRDVGRRPVTGAATEAIQMARETLNDEKRVGNHLFICGPLALRSLLLARGASVDSLQSLEFAHALAGGTSLAQLAKLAADKNFHLQLVFRKPGQPIPAQAVIHWKVGHFAAIVGRSGN